MLVIVAAQASAVVWTFNDPMTGLQEVPANASPAFGNINGTYDDLDERDHVQHDLVRAGSEYHDAHFHAAAVGVAGGVQIGPAGFPLGVTSGSFGGSHVLSGAQEHNSEWPAGSQYPHVHVHGW